MLARDGLERFSALFAALMFYAVFLSFIHTIGIGDFWWHLASGRVILENRALHAEDLFSFTTFKGYDPRKTTFLTGCWLYQAVLYLVYLASGFGGLVFFNALLFTMVLYALYRLLRVRGADPYLGLLIVFFSARMLSRFSVIRPQEISFLFAVVMVLVFERGLKELEERSDIRAFTTTPLAFASLVMVAWANMHQGFIVGYAITGVYLASETVKRIFKTRGALSRQSYRNLVFWSLCGLSAILLNPNLAKPILVVIREIEQPTYAYLVGFRNVLDYAAYKQDYPYLYMMVAEGVLCLVFMAASWRRVRLAHVLLFLGFLYEGMMFRLSIFFVLVSAALGGMYLSFLAGGVLRRLRPAVALLAFLLAINTIAGSFRPAMGSLKSPLDGSLPDEAVDFVLENKLEPNLFNTFEYGGYLIWRMYPRYRVFVYSNTIDHSALEEYEYAAMGTRMDLFDKYGVNTALVAHIEPDARTVQGIVLQLIKKRDWRLVYYDEKASVFVREAAGYAPLIPALDKREYLDLLFRFALSEAEKRLEDPLPYYKLADMYFAVGDFANADLYYKKARSIESR
jgi:hypothetical protein